jgi:nicotinamide-nucleotide amidase
MVYPVDEINSIKKILTEKGQTLSLAESVTSGHLQAAFSLADKASEFFQGGITVYNLGQKCRHLSIEPIHAQDHNCVSDKVSVEMALNVNKKFLSDYGIAITGYAATVPEQGINELFAHCAIALRDRILFTERIVTQANQGYDAQVDFARQVIVLFLSFIKIDY